MKGSLFTNKPSSSPSATPPRTHHNVSESTMEENIDIAESIIRKWDLDSHIHEKFSSLFSDDRNESTRFLQAVYGLQEAMHYYVKSNSSSNKLVKAQILMQIAMKRLEKEFHLSLSSNKKNLDSESVFGHSSRGSTSRSTSLRISDFYEDEVSEDEETAMNATPPLTPPRGTPNPATDTAVMDLKSIADCMIASGYSKECVNIYKLIRKSIIDEAIYYLGVEKLNFNQMQKMEWDVLELKIRTWIHAAKVAVKTLFHGEKILCDIVFSSSENIADSSFAEISKEAAITLFTFPENFGKSKKILSPEKTFRALDLYETISDLWPEIELIFSHDSLTAVRSEAVAAMLKLGEAVRIMLAQFEAAIQKDTSKSTSGGGVHPLTRYVMNFLVFLGDYSGPISDILADWPVTVQTPLPESYFSSPTSGGGEDSSGAAITARLAWLILVLLCKLDGKAVLYNENVALSYLFLANNLNYVVSKVRNSSLGLLMGVDWIWKHGSKVQQYIAKYERMGWGEVLASFPENEISGQEARDFFGRFNNSFEEAYRKQSSWVIPDPKLRDEVKISLAKKIVPGYRVIYMKHRGNYVNEGGNVMEPIIRYAPEDLDNYLSDLFFATAGASISGQSKTATTNETSSRLSRYYHSVVDSHHR